MTAMYCGYIFFPVCFCFFIVFNCLFPTCIVISTCLLFQFFKNNINSVYILRILGGLQLSDQTQTGSFLGLETFFFPLLYWFRPSVIKISYLRFSQFAPLVAGKRSELPSIKMHGEVSLSEVSLFCLST